MPSQFPALTLSWRHSHEQQQRQQQQKQPCRWCCSNRSSRAANSGSSDIAAAGTYCWTDGGSISNCSLSCSSSSSGSVSKCQLVP